ncbi:8535_t:CDS:2 [Funneliformis caledonium]|uniref:8535_t:CDS:1 n=1 Tax=Funneliformis caledonium TaxID=1117310 RepID=A0A9N9HXS9_9GLOM|nr:8535_t:CDS:2 [Funneliformis caledonium]
MFNNNCISAYIHDFDSKSSDWNIIAFLDECTEKSYQLKISLYLTSLENILKNEQGKRKEKARFLYDRYKKSLSRAKTSVGAQGDRPDHKCAKDWETENISNKMKIGPSINISNSTFSGDHATINNEPFNVTGTNRGTKKGTKRNENWQEDNDKVPKRTKINYYFPACDQPEQTPEHKINLSNAFVSPAIKSKRQSTKSTNDDDDNNTEIEEFEFSLANFDVAYQSLDQSGSVKKTYTRNYVKKTDDFSDFDLAYLNFDPKNMWTLKSSGRVVEKAKKLFNNDEWNEIFSLNLKQVPKVDKNIIDLLKKYTLHDLSTLQQVIFENIFPDNVPYSTDLNYINLAYRSMYSLWKGEVNFTSAQKLEGWFEMNVWAHLVDPVFCGMEIELVRGEGQSLSSSYAIIALNLAQLKLGETGREQKEPKS